jgi:hypothetical protein
MRRLKIIYQASIFVKIVLINLRKLMSREHYFLYIDILHSFRNKKLIKVYIFVNPSFLTSKHTNYRCNYRRDFFLRI